MRGSGRAARGRGRLCGAAMAPVHGRPRCFGMCAARCGVATPTVRNQPLKRPRVVRPRPLAGRAGWDAMDGAACVVLWCGVWCGVWVCGGSCGEVWGGLMPGWGEAGVGIGAHVLLSSTGCQISAFEWCDDPRLVRARRLQGVHAGCRGCAQAVQGVRAGCRGCEGVRMGGGGWRWA